MSVSFVSMPSMMVTALPNFLVSRRTLILCCSLLISPHTQMSFGKPHVGQISGIVLCWLSVLWEYLRVIVGVRFSSIWLFFLVL